MTPIFDADNFLVAWFDGQYLFDLDNEWVAFHERANIFSTHGTWLGPLRDGSFLDFEGRPVAWLALPGARPAGGLRPSAPMNARRPLPPKRPLRPRTPLPPGRPLPPSEGWSPLTWPQWVGKAPPAPSQAADLGTIRVESVDATGLEAFFDYLDEHVAGNGLDGRYFQPLPRAESRLDAGLRQSFRDGLAPAVGEPGWRRAWVARDASGRVLGHVDLRGHPERFTGHRCLLGMGVHHEHRRRGLGARLLGHAEQWAAALGVKWIDLRVLSANEPAVTLYRNAGYQMSGGTPDMFAVDGQSLGLVFMAKRLAQAAGRSDSTITVR